jgi:hypothetical protein
VERLGEPVVASAGRESESGWRYEPLAESYSAAYVARTGQQRRAGNSSRRWKQRDQVPTVHRPHHHDPRYPLGCTVRHAKFGEGTVLSVDGEGADRKIEVHFVRFGRKKLVEKYSSLERV